MVRLYFVQTFSSAEYAAGVWSLLEPDMVDIKTKGQQKPQLLAAEQNRGRRGSFSRWYSRDSQPRGCGRSDPSPACNIPIHPKDRQTFSEEAPPPSASDGARRFSLSAKPKMWWRFWVKGQIVSAALSLNGTRPSACRAQVGQVRCVHR